MNLRSFVPVIDWLDDSVVRVLVTAQTVLAATTAVMAWSGSFWGPSETLTALLILIQVVVSGIAGYAASCHLRGHAAATDRVLILLGMAAMGPLGMAGAFLACGLARVDPDPLSAEEWLAMLMPPSEIDRGRELHELLLRFGSTDGAASVASFVDVIEGGTFAQKQVVVTLIADHFRTEYLPALNLALNDPEPAIRVQAATAAARIENQFVQRSLALAGELDAHPEDVDVLRRAARHHLDYANSGMLEGDRLRSELFGALGLYGRILGAVPEDVEAAAACARVHLALNDPDAALECLKGSLNGSLPPAVMAPVCDILYRRGEFGALRRVAALSASLADGALDERDQEALRMWAPANA